VWIEKGRGSSGMDKAVKPQPPNYGLEKREAEAE
jgi:hypothetical protein